LKSEFRKLKQSLYDVEWGLIAAMKPGLGFSSYIAMVLLQTSCGIAPYINCSEGKNVHEGMTQAEVLKLMGDPYFVSLSKGSVVFGWQDKEDVRQVKNSLQVTINPQTRLINKVEGTCSQ
jgi:hypothetical protein